MSQNKVFEGRAELNIQPFLDALEAMRQRSASSVTEVSDLFRQLDTNIGAAVRNIRTNLRGVAQDISALGKALAGVNGQLRNANQAAQQAKAGAAGAAGGVGLSAAQRAQERALQAGYAREIDLIKKAGAEKVRLTRQVMQEIINNARYYDAQLIRQNELRVARERQLLEQALQQKRQLEAAARQQQVDAQLAMVRALASGDTKGAAGARVAYRDAVQDARAAIEEQKALQRQLTEVTRAETSLQKAALREMNAAVKESAHQTALSGALGIKAQFSALQDELKRVEDRWNSIFRAGTQLSSLGSQFTQFAQQVSQVGYELSNTAGDFDFWIARTRAAMQAAGSNEAVASVELLRDRTLELGRELGSLEPAQLAEGWFTYQAALGTTIQSVEDLNVAQAALTTMLQAGIISASDPATVMRGVAGVLAAYRLETDQAAYATSVLMNVTQRTQAEFQDLLEAYKMVGSNAAVMNASIAETSTLLAMMAEQNIKGSQAGRSLNMVYSRLLDPTKEANQALQEILVTSQGLTGTWRDVAFAGGSFIGMLGQIDAQGNVVKQGFIEKFVQPFMELPKAIRDTALGEAIGKIFPENAARGILPVMTRYADALEKVRQGGEGAKNEILQMYAEFANGATQAQLFENQWTTVSESVRVRLDQATYGLREAMVRIGLIVAETFIPVMETISQVAARFADWAQENPKLASSIIAVVGGMAALAAVIGPILVGLGLVLQGISGLAVAKTALAGATGILTNAFTKLGPMLLGVARGAFPALVAALGGISAPVWALIALIGLLAAAWYTNWNGIGDFMNGIVGLIGTSFQSLGDIVGGVMGLIVGLVTGNNEQVLASFEQLGPAVIELLLVIPEQAGQLFTTLAGNMEVWGYNIMISLANGLASAAQYVWSVVNDVAEGIAQFFRSFSPPRYGPLRGIYVWGRNLISTFIEGMNAADIDAVSDIAGRIGDALKVNIDFGEGGLNIDRQAVLLEANELAAQMVGIIQDGGRVNEEFFGSLREGLGEWYDDIVGILLAYQEVYAAERALEAEQEKLKLIQEQRKELEKQNQLRQDAFDAYLSGSDGSSFENNQQYIVDPTTDEGKAEIERMRRTLTTEDFQTWINFQKRMWEQKAAAEDKALATQEDAAQAAVDAYTKQLEIVKTQYDYLVKMYEYAKGLMELAKPEKETGAGGGGGGGAAQRGNVGNPEDLEEARRRIRELVGEDQAIYDEKTLRDQRGGDDIGALDDASAQERREQDRLATLEEENRRRRAKFETDLINAKSDEERARLKQQMDAWDASYKEEKARLTERKQLTDEITQAADQQAELSSSARIQEERAEAEQAISDALQGQLSTQGDLKQEERELQDLRNLGDRKRLEFEQRLREAQGDEAATRRIKEEQQAWEEAYGAALQAQEERVEALRRAKQDQAAASAGAAGGGYSVPDAGDFTPGLAGAPQPVFDPADYGINLPEPAEREEDQAIRPTLEKARKMWEDFKRGWDFLASDDIDIGTKMQALWGSIKDALGWETAWDALAPKEFRDRIQRGWNELGRRISEGWNGLVGGIQNGWNNFWNGLKQGWENNVSKPATELWTTFTSNLKTGWNTYVVQPVSGWWNDVTTTLEGWKNGFLGFLTNLGYFLVGVFATYFYEPLKAKWDEFWPQLKQKWEEFSTNVRENWTTFWSNLKQRWEEFKTPLVEGWNQFWSNLKQSWETFKLNVAEAWNQFWSGLKQGWESFKLTVAEAWNQFWSGLKQRWEEFKGPLVEAWNQFWTDLNQRWTEFKDPLVEAWNQFWIDLNTKWTEFKDPFVEAFRKVWDDIKAAWDTFVENFNTKVEDFKKGMDSIKSAIQGVVDSVGGWVSDMIAKGKSLLGGLGGGGKKDGSHAGGLYRVPFDGYLAELHAGERVLTSEEAAAYNQMEASGMLRNLSAFVSRAASAVDRARAATAPASAGASSTTVNEGSTSRVTNINIGKVEATNPNAGKAFLQQLAFLG